MRDSLPPTHTSSTCTHIVGSRSVRYVDRCRGVTARTKSGVAQATSTVPADVFYILKLVLGRALGAGSLRALERTVGRLRDVLDGQYAGAARQRLHVKYARAARERLDDASRAERERRLAFVVRPHRGIFAALYHIPSLLYCSSFPVMFHFLRRARRHLAR
jgi:hypothetical protein